MLLLLSKKTSFSGVTYLFNSWFQTGTQPVSIGHPELSTPSVLEGLSFPESSEADTHLSMWMKVLPSVAQLNRGQDRGLSSSQQCTGFSVGDGNIEGTLANADLCLQLRERDL